MKNLKKTLTYFLVIFSFFTIFIVENPHPELVSKENIILSNARSDRIEWRYKKVNNKIYKRLFNCTTSTWIGDWILVK